MIKSNASVSEKSSPFYEVNQSFCLEFEKFILERNGTCSGSYNAWSYLLLGKILEPKEWVLEYKKSTFTSGNLLLSSKSQNLFTSVIWKTKGCKNSDFIIRRKKAKDTFLRIFNSHISNFDTFNNYILVSNTNTPFIWEISRVLKPLIISKEVYQISNKNRQLKIELRTDKHYFDIFKQLIDLEILD